MNGWTRFSAMQDQYNVLKREEERDMIPMCLDQGVGLTPYSPLAKGRATRPWGEQSARSSAETVAKTFDRDVDKPVVSCPIVGATKPIHLHDAATALDVALTDDEITELEERYTPQDNYWW